MNHCFRVQSYADFVNRALLFGPTFLPISSNDDFIRHRRALLRDFSLTFSSLPFAMEAFRAQNTVEFLLTLHGVLGQTPRCSFARMPSSPPEPQFVGRRANFGSADNQTINFPRFAGTSQNTTLCHENPTFCYTFLSTPSRARSGSEVRNVEWVGAKDFDGVGVKSNRNLRTLKASTFR